VSAAHAGRVSAGGPVPAQAGSELSLELVRLGAGETAAVGRREADLLLYAFSGEGALRLAGGEHLLPADAAALVLAGETGSLEAGAEGLEAVCAVVGPKVDRHAPLGARELVVELERAEAAGATGKRSFQVLLGPHNGSTRATLFMGYIPPGRAPWHYHLYDEIVWVRRGAGRLHTAGGAEPLAAGSAFRLSPRELHIVENVASAEELAVLGVFTPAGSPSAAYLPAGSEEAYAVESAPARP
jgi:quercetin dioxygenase-like cupin family protein